MVVELAQIDVRKGCEIAFVEAFAEAAPLFRAAKGCDDFRLYRGVERESRFFLQIRWHSIDDHMVSFRKSPAFSRWRELVGHLLDGPPVMEHAELIAVNA